MHENFTLYAWSRSSRDRAESDIGTPENKAVAPLLVAMQLTIKTSSLRPLGPRSNQENGAGPAACLLPSPAAC